MISCFTGKVGWFPKILMESPVDTLRLLDHVIGRGRVGKVVMSLQPTHFTRIPLGDAIPFSLPPLSVAFSGNAPIGVQEDVEEMGGTFERISTSRKDTYLIPRPTISDYQKATTFPHIDQNHVAPRSHISVPSIVTFFKLQTRLTASVRHVNLVAQERENPGVFEWVEDGDTVDRSNAGLRPVAEVPVSPSAMQQEEGQVDEVTTSWTIGNDEMPHLLLNYDALRMDRVFFGGVDRLPQSPGLFIPFEANYSQSDVSGLTGYLQRYRGIFIDSPDNAMNEISDIMYDWTTEICKTLSGERMAHLMKCLEMAAQMYCGIYVVMRPGGVYEGSVLLGEDIVVKQMGMKPAVASTAIDLEEELESFGFHAICLRRVLETMNAEVTTEVGGMRQLRDIVMRNGMPSGTQRNTIEKLIPNLSFDERPLVVNPNTLTSIFDLLSSSGEIPQDLYLGFESFFDIGRTHLILAAFGEMAPSFSFGGTRLRATARVGKGTSQIDAYSTSPPAVLQTKAVPLKAAVPQWNSMMQSGIISTDTKTRVTGSRVYLAQAKASVWTSLGAFLDKTVIVPETAVPPVEAGSSKRRREDDGVASTVAAKVSRLFF
jgi:hypothetical protein